MKIIYLFKAGRKKRLSRIRQIPSEFFYGYKEIYNKGFEVELMEQEDIGISSKYNFFQKFINYFSKYFFDFPLIIGASFLWNKGYRKLNSDYIICTTNALGITVGFAKRIGLIKPQVIFIIMGLFKQKPNFLKKILYENIIKNSEIFCLSKGEINFLKTIFPKKEIQYLPFGIDIQFWKSSPKNISQKYVLAVGNDLARDWNILIKSWKAEFPNLKIITSRSLVNFKKNIQIINGNWHNEVLSDNELRSLYSNAEFVIIPLKETYQPSGQSVCLQSMACGKPVIMTRVEGIWDQEILKNGENIILIKPNSIDQLRISVTELLKNKSLKRKLSLNGMKIVEKYFNVELMSDIIIDKIQDNNKIFKK